MILYNQFLDDFLSPPIDFEYKKYKLLHFVNNIVKNTNDDNIVDNINETEYIINELNKISENFKLFKENFPKEIVSLSIKDKKILYKDLIEDDESTIKMREIIDYSIIKFKNLHKYLITLINQYKDNITFEWLYQNNSNVGFLIHNKNILRYFFENDDITITKVIKLNNVFNYKKDNLISLKLVDSKYINKIKLLEYFLLKFLNNE
jgi:hypothetical protein